MTKDPSVRSRRAVALVVLSMVVPGSAQRLVGNERIGRWALRILLAMLAVLVILGLVALLAGGFVVGLLLEPLVAVIARVLVWGLFLGWALLLLDAWRLARPLDLARGARLALSSLVVAGLVAMAGGTSLVARALTAAQEVSAVFTGGGDTEASSGRYNILLLGVDAADDRLGVRPDSINVASVDARTGRTVLFGLPRNLERVPFPETSPLDRLHPEGYDCDGCRLNAIYTLGEDNAELYPEGDAGLTAIREAVGHVLGLDINYHAMVDMAGFSALVDAVGGVTLDSNVRVPIGGGSSAVSGYIEPGDDIHLDGYHALWFARSRHDSSDYERMVRQKCVVKAMARQLDPATVATRFVALSRAGRDLVSTDVPPREVAELTELALKAKSLPIETVNFSPPLITPGDPDFDLIRAEVAAALEAPEEPSPEPAPSPGEGPTAAAAVPARGSGTPSTGPEAPAAADPDEDVEWLCRVS